MIQCLSMINEAISCFVYHIHAKARTFQLCLMKVFHIKITGAGRNIGRKQQRWNKTASLRQGDYVE